MRKLIQTEVLLLSAVVFLTAVYYLNDIWVSIAAGAGAYLILSILCCLSHIDKIILYLFSLAWSVLAALALVPFSPAIGAGAGTFLFFILLALHQKIYQGKNKTNIKQQQTKG